MTGRHADPLANVDAHAHSEMVTAEAVKLLAEWRAARNYCTDHPSEFHLYVDDWADWVRRVTGVLSEVARG